MLKSIVIILAVNIVSISVYGDCFQETAHRFESGLIPGISLSTPKGQLRLVLLEEIKRCSGLEGPSLWWEIFNNGCKIESGIKSANKMEWDLTIFLQINHPIPKKDAIKMIAPNWYQAENEMKKQYYEHLCAYSISSSDRTHAGIYDYNFTDYKTIYDNEPSPSTDLSLAILDFLFTRSPGLALVTMNNTLSNEEIGNLKAKIDLLVMYHKWKDPRSWSKENLQPAKDALNSLISSNYAYIDLFIAEIVNVVHDLRTPEVDAFLAQSTHPLVIKRLQHPFIYEPLEIPE